MNKDLRPGKICPECGHQFQGNGWDGIDAHWRSKHESEMPYRVAWPQIKSGTYRKRTGSIVDFSGCLKREGDPRFTIAQIKKITEMCWAGEFDKIDEVVAGWKP